VQSYRQLENCSNYDAFLHILTVASDGLYSTRRAGKKGYLCCHIQSVTLS